MRHPNQTRRPVQQTYKDGCFFVFRFFLITNLSDRPDKISNDKTLKNNFRYFYFLMPRVLFFSLRYGFLHFLHLVALMSFLALQLKQIFINRRAPCAIRFFSGSVMGIWLSPFSPTFILIGFSHLSCKQYWYLCWSFGYWNVCLVKH